MSWSPSSHSAISDQDGDKSLARVEYPAKCLLMSFADSELSFLFVFKQESNKNALRQIIARLFVTQAWTFRWRNIRNRTFWTSMDGISIRLSELQGSLSDDINPTY